MKEMIRVLIADDSAAFGKACQKELKSGGFDCVLTQKDGNRVISLLDTQHFDVVVMDVFMSGADAMEVLEHMEPMAEKPLVLLLSSMDTPEFEEQMIRAGADYMLIKPVRPQSVAHRISRLSQWKAKSKNPRSADVQGADLDLIISDIMRQIGVPAHIKGYQYLRSAIKLSVASTSPRSQATSMAWRIARSTREAVVPCILATVGYSSFVTLLIISEDVLSSYFGYTIQSQRGKPTNSEFIAMIADKLKLTFKSA